MSFWVLRSRVALHSSPLLSLSLSFFLVLRVCCWFVSLSLSLSVSLHIDTCVYTCVCIYIYIYIYLYMYMYIYIYLLLHTHTCTHACLGFEQPPMLQYPDEALGLETHNAQEQKFEGNVQRFLENMASASIPGAPNSPK